MNIVIKNVLRLTVFLFIQVFILNQIPPLHQFVVPYVYFLFLLWLPFRITPLTLLYVGFGLGLISDMFFKTPGLHLAACGLVAYLRPYVVNLLLPKEATEWGNQEPSTKTMGSVPYWTYMVIMTLLHHFYLILMEWLQFGSFFYFIGKLIATTVLSLALFQLFDLFMNRNSKVR